MDVEVVNENYVAPPKANLDYGQVIGESCQLFWRHKIIWVFGVLAAFLGQGEYRSGAGFRTNFNAPSASTPPPAFYDFFQNPWVVRVLEDPLPYLLGGLILSLVIGMLLSLVGWLPKGALVGMAAQIERDGETSLRAGWQLGARHFLRLFLINFMLGLPQAALSLPGAIVLVWFGVKLFAGMSGLLVSDLPDMEAMQQLAEVLVPVLVVSLACLVPLVCLAAFVGFFLNLLNELAARSCVIEGLGVIASIRRGWQLGRDNPGFTILTFIILWAAKGVFGLLVGIPAGLLMIPAAGGLMRGDRLGIVIAGLLGFLGYTLVMQVGIGGVLTAFNSTLWTKLFLAFGEEQ